MKIYKTKPNLPANREREKSAENVQGTEILPDQGGSYFLFDPNDENTPEQFKIRGISVKEDRSYGDLVRLNFKRCLTYLNLYFEDDDTTPVFESNVGVVKGVIRENTDNVYYLFARGEKYKLVLADESRIDQIITIDLTS